MHSYRRLTLFHELSETNVQEERAIFCPYYNNFYMQTLAESYDNDVLHGMEAQRSSESKPKLSEVDHS